MDGHEVALIIEIIGGQAEKVLVPGVMGELPGGPVLTGSAGVR
jgi:hypothetical protein